tara:strand:+ start:7636 stop:8559 length:924 start_codon:yes stop_codon:yes gene_type:complete
LKVIVFGSTGLVGSAVMRKFNSFPENYEVVGAKRSEADLFSINETKEFILKNSPNLIVNCAAKVGGIVANNTNRTEFILENLKININILESIIQNPDISLINLGSSCIYPLNAENPIKETSLMNGKLEPTNSPYAMAKLTAIEMGDALKQQYGHKIINLMPTNLYGPNDHFSEKDSHVIPGLIFRMEKAKQNKEPNFSVWGTGTPKREFLHVNDLASAIHFIAENNISEDILNVGSGDEVTISELVKKIKNIVGFKGDILFDKSMPDGNPRKLLDSSKLNSLGWSKEIELDTGLTQTYDWFRKNILN